MTDQAITPTAKPKRVLRQPSKDELRRQLEVERARVAYLQAPWQVKVLAWLKAWT